MDTSNWASWETTACAMSYTVHLLIYLSIFYFFSVTDLEIAKRKKHKQATWSNIIKYFSILTITGVANVLYENNKI